MISAFTIGIAFGFVLERGGLGNAKKLAAQFYLTDMTVFKVMFTAIITAMVGIYLLSLAGLIQLSLMLVTPTFIFPQMVGGVLFGIGFVMGGYCPGTSCISASTGKQDALVFIAGMVAGILLFGEMFEFVRDFYYMTPMGSVTIPTLLQIPYGIVVATVVCLAFAGFVLATRVEKATARRQN